MANPLTDRLRTWWADWIRPVYASYYRRDHDAGLRLLSDARAGLAGGAYQFSTDEAQTVELMLILARYNVDRSASTPETLPGLIDTTVAQLRESAHDGVISTFFRNRSLLELLIDADRDGIRELAAAEFDEIFDAIPEEYRDGAVWYNAATWLFDHRRPEQMQQAYEVMVQANRMDLKQFPYRRIKLMYQLLTETARDEDIIYYLKNLEFHNAFEEFRRFFLPLAGELGLDTPVVRAAIEDTRKRFAASDPVSPY